MPFNSKLKFRDNISAIKLAFTLQKQDKKANAIERESLLKYCGFGGLKCILNNSDIDSWKDYEKDLFPLYEELHAILKENSTGDDQYKAYVNSLKSSTLTAFYTPTEVTNVIAKSFEGLNPVKILDPSAGSGIFIESFQEQFKATQITGFEKDLITGLILKASYPQAKVFVEPFEDIRSEQRNYDIVTSNIPFGNFNAWDASFVNSKDKIKQLSCRSIHNYFFIKSLDVVRDGGLIAFITTESFLDSPSHEPIRKRLFESTNLVSSIRLPLNLFNDTANVKVGSDLIILQRNFNKKALSKEETLLLKSNIETGVNNYYSNLINVVHTKGGFDTNQFGRKVSFFEHDGGIEKIAVDINTILQHDIYNNLDTKLYNDHYITQQRTTQNNLFSFQPDLFSTSDTVVIPYTEKIPNYLLNGSFVQFQNQIGILNINGDNPTFEPKYYNSTQKEQIVTYIHLRNTYFELFEYENSRQQENKVLRNTLNNQYDNYTQKWGVLNKASNVEILLLDPKGKEILSLEKRSNNNFIKSDIFSSPVAFSQVVLENISVFDALTSSLNKFGNVNLAYIEEVSSVQRNLIIESLQEKIFFNPNINDYEIKDKYLSGNIYEKIENVKNYIYNNPDNVFAINSLSALEKVLPEPIPFELLDFNLGERWIDTKIYAEFASDLFKTDISINYSKNRDEYKVTGSYNSLIGSTYAVSSESRLYTGLHLLEYALENTSPDITKTITGIDGKPQKVKDNEKIQLINTKIDGIRDEFIIWLKSKDIVFQNNLAEAYNKLFNCYAKPVYDGSHQIFPGLDLKALGIPDLYNSQKNAIWMTILNEGGIIDHEVGGGKTLIMCVTAYEMKRLGIVNKPLITGLKANIGEIARTYKTAYPNAKILYPGKDDFTPSKRVEILKDIKNNNYDCIFLTHEQYGKIPQSLEISKRLFEEELNNVELDLLELSTTPNRALQKGLEKRKENLTAKLNLVLYEIQNKKDDIPDFNSMGIDHIFCDESQQFKNLMYSTRHTRVAGLGNSEGSQRATNFLLGIRTLQDKKDKDLCVTLVSGTPISNSLIEMYLIFKYTRPRELERQGIINTDSWLATFARKTTEFEYSITNEIIQKERYRHFIKVPELAMFYNQITDYKSAEMIGLDRPKAVETLIQIDQTPDQEYLSSNLIEYVKTGDPSHIGRLSSKSDLAEKMSKMLIAYNYAKKTALDVRMIDQTLEDHPNNKISVCAKEIAHRWEKTKHFKGVQLVFSDLGTYKPGESGFNVYSALKSKLVNEYGIPQNEIRFIQEISTDSKRQQLFNDTNAGNVRILMGSTQMLGTGVNVQELLIGIHHLDIPVKPSELEQRDGRGVRKGNKGAKLHNNNLIDILVYGVKKSLDVFKFTLLKNKQTFIKQIKNSTLAVRSFDEGAFDEHTGISMNECIAVLSGNTDLLERAKLQRQIANLESSQQLFYKDKYNSKKDLSFYSKELSKWDFVYINLLKDQDKIKGIDFTDKTIPINLKNYQSSNIEEQGLAILNYNKQNTYGKSLNIGSILGFDIIMKSEIIREEVYNTFTIKGAHEYSFNNGYISTEKPETAVKYFTHSLAKIPKLIIEAKEKTDKLNENIKLLSDSLDNKWPFVDKLNAEKILLENLNKKIEISLKQKDNKETVINIECENTVIQESKSHYSKIYPTKVTIKSNKGMRM